MKEIKFYTDAQKSMIEGVDILANAVSSTLGPKGRSVIIGKKSGLPHVTKDGVTVAKEIELKDNFQNIGAQLVKEVASKTCNDVGDGTTTATILARSIINEGIKSILEGSNPILIKKGIELATQVVLDFIKNKSTDIAGDFESIKNIATISANNDETLGNLIAEAFEQVTDDGVVIAEESNNITTFCEVIKGMQFDRGFIAPHFITDQIKNEAIIEDCCILITDMKVITMKDIVTVLEGVVKNGKSILIIAENYENEVIESLKLNKIQGNLKVIPIHAPSFGQYRKEMLQDIAILTGGDFVSMDSGMKLSDAVYESVGRCDKVIVTKDSTTIIGGKGQQQFIETRVKQIKHQLSETDSEVVANMCKERIAKLIGGIAVIYVGGTTEIEMKERKDRVDDAIAATRAAIEEGIVVGGGTTYLKCYGEINNHKNFNKYFTDVNNDVRNGIFCVLESLIAPFIQLLENSGLMSEFDTYFNEIIGSTYPFGLDINSEQVVDLFSAGVIDPTKVSRMALENAASIATLFLTSECVIAEENTSGFINVI